MVEHIEQRYRIKCCATLEEYQTKTIKKLKRYLKIVLSVSPILWSDLIVSKVEKSPLKVSFKVKDHQLTATN